MKIDNKVIQVGDIYWEVNAMVSTFLLNKSLSTWIILL